MIIIFIGYVSYSWYMLLFSNSEFYCGTKLSVHKIYISKLLLWNNRNSVTIYLVSNDSLMCFWVYGELITERRTLGSDDLMIFKCFTVISSLKKKTIQFLLLFNLYIQQKKETQSCQFASYRRNALFLTSETGQMTFTIFKVIIRQLCISLTH